MSAGVKLTSRRVCRIPGRVLKAMAAPGTAGRIGRDHAGVALPSALLLVAGAPVLG